MRRGSLALTAVLVALAIGLGAESSAPLTEEPTLPGGHFIDDNGNLHEANIEAVAAQGITLGCNQQGTAYCPDLILTRAQMASLLARALDLPPGSAQFSDVSAANVHGDAIAALATA